MPAALKKPLPESDFAPENPPPFPAAKPRSVESRPAVTGARSSSERRASAPRSAAVRAAASASEKTPDATPDPLARPYRLRTAPRPAASSLGAGTGAGETTPPRSRAERRHRRFRPTLTAVLCGGALLGQLVLLLWLHGKTLTSAREVEKMDARIAEVSNHIERTQERIAAYDSSPQVKQWAAQAGWKPAAHPDFDDTTNPEQARAIAQAQAAAQATAQPGEESAR